MVGHIDTRHEDRPVAELVRQFSEQTSHLVRDEIRLARIEMREAGKHAGVGAGLFSGAGLFGFFGFAALVTAAIAALALVLQVWAAALIVAGALFLVAGIAALIGKRQISQADPMPKRASQNVRRDVDELKGN